MAQIDVQGTALTQQHVGRVAGAGEVYDAIGNLAGLLSLCRPTSPSGKHGDLHTPLCGCVDR